MKTIVLHVGTHKTGSTSIQKTLEFRKDQLRERGIDVYRCSKKASIYRAFTDCPKNCHQYYRGWNNAQNREQVLRRVKRRLASNKYQTHLVSSEVLSLLSETSLCDLRTFLLDECGFDRVVVVCFLRNPIAYLNSLIQQDIKPGLNALSDIINNAYMNYTLFGCPSFRGGMMNILNQIYFPTPNKLIQAFGHENVIFVKFEEAIKSGLTGVLLSHATAENIILKDDELRANETISHEASVLLAEYNNRHPRLLKDNKLNMERYRNKTIVPVLQSIPGRKPEFADMALLDIPQICDSVREINSMIGWDAMDVPQHGQQDKLTHNSVMYFSVTSLIAINKLLGYKRYEPMAAGREMTERELREINDELESIAIRDKGGLYMRLMSYLFNR